MTTDILERIFLSDNPGLSNELVSIPAIRNSLYTIGINENSTSLFRGYRVARISSEEAQNAEMYCQLRLGNTIEPIIQEKTNYPNLRRFLKRKAREMHSLLAYYKAITVTEAHYVEFHAWVYDYTSNSEKNEYSFSEFIDQGLSGIDYFEGTNPTRHDKYYPDDIRLGKQPLFLTPFIGLVRSYIYLEWDPKIDWEKFRVTL